MIVRPSGAEQWTRCQASLVMQDAYPEPYSENTPAQEGTAAHALAAHILRRSPGSAWRYVGRKLRNPEGEPIEVTEEMAEAIDVYVGAVVAASEDGLCETRVEQRVELSAVLDVDFPLSGTPDAVVIDSGERTLKALDFKYGQWVTVLAHGNPQIILYALGVAHELALPLGWKVEIHVIQPRRSAAPDVWKTTVRALHVFRDTFRESAARAYSLATRDRVTDEALESDILAAQSPSQAACEFCSAKAHCRAFTAWAASLMEGMRDMPVPDIPAADVAEMFNQKKAVNDWLDAANSRLRQELLSGARVPGVKLVNSPRKRFFKVPDSEVVDVVRGLGLDPYTKPKLRSPPDIAAELNGATYPGNGKKAYIEHIEPIVARTQPNPIVAASTDRRAAWTPPETAEDMAAEFEE